MRNMPKSKTPKPGKPLAHWRVTAYVYTCSIPQGEQRVNVVFNRWHQPNGPRTKWIVDHDSVNVRLGKWNDLRPVLEAAGAMVTEEERG